MIPGALALRHRYKELTLPVVIMAGEGDKVVFKRNAEQLRATIKQSVLYIVAGAGHMVHHLAALRVVAAVKAVADLASRARPASLSIPSAGVAARVSEAV